jgi:multidrug transporter EmrE-like cation transporter
MVYLIKKNNIQSLLQFRPDYYYKQSIKVLSSMKKYLLLFPYLFSTVIGLIFIKLGGDSFEFSINNFGTKFSISWKSLIGLFFYFISFLLWTIIIPKYDLSFIMPVVIGMVQVLTLIAAFSIFNESISSINLIGILLVIVGIVLVNL